ncbi:MAG: MTH1187 family thiamine-binding protein [Clostridiaceae bacterium]|nr:MTH1187 family thiamine-binding protein [Clostridiaceae bacterium]
MALMEITVVPLGTESTSVSKYVAACHKVLKEEKEIQYQLTPMATVIEADLDRLFEIAKKLHNVPFQEGAMRVATTIKIDDRRDKETTIKGKIASVESKL